MNDMYIWFMQRWWYVHPWPCDLLRNFIGVGLRQHPLGPSMCPLSSSFSMSENYTSKDTFSVSTLDQACNHHKIKWLTDHNSFITHRTNLHGEEIKTVLPELLRYLKLVCSLLLKWYMFNAQSNTTGHASCALLPFLIGLKSDFCSK